MRVLVVVAAVMVLRGAAWADDFLKPPIMLHVAVAHLSINEVGRTVAVYSVKNETGTSFASVEVICAALDQQGDPNGVAIGYLQNVEANEMVYGQSAFSTQIAGGSTAHCRIGSVLSHGSSGSAPSVSDRQKLDNLLGRPAGRSTLGAN